MSDGLQTTDITVRAPYPAGASAQASAAPAHHGLSFHSIFSALNPLQLIPVVGTIYRAITGVEGAPNVRFWGSIAVSALTGGPIGVGVTLAEQITGINPESILFRLLGIHTHHTDTQASTAGATASSAGTPTKQTIAAPSLTTTQTSPSAAAWTPAQLQAYGVKTQPDGNLTRGGTSGADVLNGLELSRIRQTA